MKFDLSTYLPYLISRVGPAVESGFWDGMRSVGLNLEEWRVVAVLYSQGPQSLNQLSERTSVKVSTLSRLVGRLAERGLVSRQRSDEDSRTVVISLLKRGRERAERIIPHCRRYEQMIEERLSDEDIAILHQLLPKLYDALIDIEYDPAALTKSAAE